MCPPLFSLESRNRSLVGNFFAVAESAHKASFALDSKWTNMTRGAEFRVEGSDAAARELGMSPLACTDSWDHEVSMQGVYRRWLELMQRGEERGRG